MKAIDCHVTRDDDVTSSPPRDLNGSGKVNGYLKGHHLEINGMSEKPSGLINGRENEEPSPTKVNGIHNGDIAKNHLNGIKLNGHLTNGNNSSDKELNGLPEGKLNSPSDLKLNGLTEVKLNGFSEVKLNSPSELKLNGLTEVKLNGFSEVKLNGNQVVKENGHVSGDHQDGDSGLVVEDGWTTVKDQTIARLEEQLAAAHHELKLRDEEVARLSRIRTEVESELEELTASLFQEAHNMVRQANVAQAQAERHLKESHMKVEVLQAEVAALKTLVITSTPSKPNTHLHPQLQQSDSTGAQGGLFNRKHRRSPSHFNLKYGRENSPPDSPVRDVVGRGSPIHLPLDQADHLLRDDIEVDPILHKEFVSWRQTPRLDQSDPFVSRIYREDIDLCLDFSNTELGLRVRAAVQEGLIFIEAVTEKSRTVFPKKCALMEVQRLCHYRMRLGDQEQWFHISQICRNRITAVCDFLNYLKYIERGLVKSSVPDVFWEIVRLRKEMSFARLGLPLS